MEVQAGAAEAQGHPQLCGCGCLAAFQGWNFRLDGTWETALKGLLWGGGLTQVIELLEAFLEVSTVSDSLPDLYGDLFLKFYPWGLIKARTGDTYPPHARIVVFCLVQSLLVCHPLTYAIIFSPGG